MACCKSCAAGKSCGCGNAGMKHGMSRGSDPFGGAADPRSMNRFRSSPRGMGRGSHNPNCGCPPCMRQRWMRGPQTPFYANVDTSWKGGSWPPVGADRFSVQRAPCGMTKDELRLNDLEPCGLYAGPDPRWSLGDQRNLDVAKKLGHV